MAEARRVSAPRLSLGKYQGLGNDFAIASADDLSPVIASLGDAPSVARLACDRRRGVGADGLLVAQAIAADASAPQGPLWQMVVYNADGSRPQMCGNGLRCFVRWLVDTGRAPALPGAHLVVQTDAGPKRCVWFGGGDVEVEIGPARFSRDALPMTGDAPHTVETLRTPWGEEVTLHGVSVGNPHAVVWEHGPRATADADRLGRWLGEHPLFPEQANVEFVHRRADSILEVVVYERGCGLTQACGTGAAAVVASWAQREGLPDVASVVALPGGSLRVRSVKGTLWLRGDAAHVFDAQWLWGGSAP